jgi:hypothetical protein
LTEIQELQRDAVGAVQRRASRTSAALWALVALYIVIRAWNLTSFCLDSDEVFSVTSARLSFGGLMSAIVYDVVHPPLFYILLKGWIVIGGTSLLWLRLLPFTLSAAALVPLFLTFRKLGLIPAARILSLAIIAANEYLVFHARYVRMYSLVFLLSLWTLYLFLAWMNEGGKRRLAALAAVNLLLVYTHYYGWLLIAAEALVLAMWARRRLKQYALATAAVLAAFGPWAIAVWHSAQAKGGLEPNLRWVRHPGVGDLLWFYAGLNGPLAPIPLASVVVFACAAIAAAGWRRDEARLRALAALAVLPPVLSFAASNALTESVWNNRHLMVSAAPYTLLVAASVCSLRPLVVRRAAMAVLAAWLAWGAYRATLAPEPQVNLGAIVSHLVERSAGEREVTVYSLDGYLPAWMRYHLEPYGAVKWNLVGIREPREVKGDRFWFAYNDKFWHNKRRPEELLRDLGYDAGPGVWAADPWNRIALIPVRRRR